jgi:mono/diheme cytochrome c family protein
MGTRGPARIAQAVAFAVAIAGAVALWLELPQRPVQAATRNGLTLRLESSRWLEDHLDHGTGFEMPSSMTPGMPARGSHRLSVEMTAAAAGRDPSGFDPAEVQLVGADGGAIGARTDLRALVLRPGEQVSAVLEFDVPGDQKTVRLVWSRSDDPVTFLASATPDHPETGVPARWAKIAEGLPPGNAKDGRRKFVEVGCVSCHGGADLGVDPTLGPGLADMARHAARRVPGKSAVQYVYDSILEPDAFIAPECANGISCTTPSAMPSYAQRLDPQALADLIAFLLEG